MFRRTVVTIALVAAAAGVGSAKASAETLGGCPPGGGWTLQPASIGPVATSVDTRGNQDGFVCQTFVSGNGQVIDNRVQAPS